MSIGITEVDATRQSLVASVVQEVLKQRSILLPTVTNYSQFATPGAKEVKIPRRTEFAAADKTENVNLSTQLITFAADTIALDKHKAVYSELERIAGIQANVNVQAEIITEMAAELALQIDKDILVELKLTSAAAPDHRIARTLSIQDDIINARTLLNKQVVPMSDRYLLVSPDAESAMLKVADFVRADAYGSAGGLINGEIGRVYGMTVLMSTLVTGDEFLAYHKSHVGFAMQAEPEYLTDVHLAGVKQEYLLHQLYGVEVLDSGKRGVWYNATGT